MQLNIMSAAEVRLSNLISSNERTRINGFRVGSTPNVTPIKTGAAPTGAMVYVGTSSQIKYTIVSQHEIVFVIYLDHDVGDFNVGNLMLYLDPLSPTSQPIPFLWASLLNATNKNDSNLPSHVVGNRVMIYATLWFPYLLNVLDLSPHEELVVRMQNWANEKALPPVSVAEYPQAVIDTHTNHNSASVVVKDPRYDVWWSNPFMQYINDPRMGQFTGGIVTEEYGSPSDVVYYNGHYYKVDNTDFDVIDGGSNWTLANEPPIIGGTY